MSDETAVNKKTVARFRVEAHLDGAKGATIEINRSNQMFSVRPLHRRQTYDMPLSAVAEMVIWRVSKDGVKETSKKKRCLRIKRGLIFPSR